MGRRTTKAAWILAISLLTSVAGYSQGPSEGSSSPTPAEAAAEPKPLPPSEIKPAPPTPIAEKKAELGDDETWQSEWDVLIEEALPNEMLSSDIAHAVKPVCPRFSSMSTADKRAFWAYLFQALAGAEAGLKPTTNVRHTEPEVAVVDSVTHRMVRSQGLLQLTYEDSKRYGCDFDWGRDKELSEHDPDKTILQPKNNLLCGVKILSNQLIDLHQPLLSKKSYWSTLRPGTISYKVFAKQLANVPAACGAVPTHKQHDREALQIREARASFPGPPSGDDGQ